MRKTLTFVPLAALALGACVGAAGAAPAVSPEPFAAAARPAGPRAHLCRRIGTFGPLVSDVLSLAMPHQAHRAGLRAVLAILTEYQLADCAPLAPPLTDPVPAQPPVLPAEPQPDPAAETPPAEPQPEESPQPVPAPETPQPVPAPEIPSEPADTTSTPTPCLPQESAR